MTSQRLEFQLIRDSLMNFDNQILNFETLSSIYAIRPQEDEIRCIQEYLRNANNNNTSNVEENLDKPELFLLELSRIPAFEERIYCLVYNNKFLESISSIEFRINNMNTVCDELNASDKVRKILGIILGCGNSMNAANKTRGDADGFDLAILPNLKDVKSKDNTTNLMHYIAGFYVNKYDDDLVKFPLPDPSDFNFVAQINFDELEKEIRKVKSEIGEVEKRIENILKCTGSDGGESLFKVRVNEFLTKARDECKEQEESFHKCKGKFQSVVKVFCVKPKAGDTEVTPEYFFSLWSAFCLDFKNSWKRETQKIAKKR
jgi:formin 2